MKTLTISCICLTHGRPYLVREALESWRRQDKVDGVMTEFLVVNDCPEQKLTCCLPGVRIINLTRPVEDLADKQNCAVEMASGEWVSFWDDDDISLSNRIAVSVAYIRSLVWLRAYKQSRAWYWEDGRVVRRDDNGIFWGSAIVERAYYQEHGRAKPGDWIDRSSWEGCLAGGKASQLDPRPEDTFHVYRWHKRSEVHDSGLSDARDSRQRHRMFRARVLGDPRFLSGVQEVVPGWDADYEAQVRDCKQRG